MTRATIVFVIGVSGCGKSTLGQALAQAIGATFLEGDDFHPPENVAHMRAGNPLNDTMRWPWLTALAQRSDTLARDGRAVVATCSCLKRSYRDLIREQCAPLTFLHLQGPPELIRTRMEARKDHYMPPALLDSQLATLETALPDEADVTLLDLRDPPETILAQALAALRLDSGA